MARQPFVADHDHILVLGSADCLPRLRSCTFSAYAYVSWKVRALVVYSLRSLAHVVGVTVHGVLVMGVVDLLVRCPGAVAMRIHVGGWHGLDETAVFHPLSNRQPRMASPSNSSQSLPSRGRGGSGALLSQVKRAPRRPRPATAAVFNRHTVALRHAEAVPFLSELLLLQGQPWPLAPLVAHRADQFGAQMAA